MSEQSTALIEIAPLAEAIQKALPNLAIGRNNAVARMQEITVIESDEDVEEANGVLVRSKEVYDYLNKQRMALTQPIDKLKADLMTFEKDVTTEDTRLRGLIGSYNQKQIDARKKQEADAKAQREKSDYLVELATGIKRTLADMVMGCAVQLDAYSKGVFDKATVENFEEVATKYNGLKPGLKQELYDKCFLVVHKSIITPAEFEKFIIELKTTETFEKWRTLAVDAMVPIINDWRAKIPTIQQQKIEIEEAEGEFKQKLEEEARVKAAQEENARKQEITNKQQSIQMQITQEADIDKASNAFVEQAQVQTLDPTGPVKKVLRITNEKIAVKAIAQIVVHCFASPKFEGIYKKDKKGVIVKDEHGNNEYAPQFEWFFNFYVKNCDGIVEGTEIVDVAKVIVRK